MRKFVADIGTSGLTGTLSKRDERYGDYRTSEGASEQTDLTIWR
jgi:hypothetical protein